MQGNTASFWGLGFSFGPSVPKGERVACRVGNKLSRLCTLVDLQDVQTTRMKGLYILRVIVKHQGVWGCKSKGIKGVYMNS